MLFFGLCLIIALPLTGCTCYLLFLLMFHSPPHAPPPWLVSASLCVLTPYTHSVSVEGKGEGSFLRSLYSLNSRFDEWDLRGPEESDLLSERDLGESQINVLTSHDVAERTHDIISMVEGQRRKDWVGSEQLKRGSPLVLQTCHENA